MKTNIIITGSKNFNNYLFIEREINRILSKNNLTPQDIVIESCGIKGIDKLIKRYAITNNVDLDLHLVVNKGFCTVNGEMVHISTMAILFWDDYSENIKDLVYMCKLSGLKIYFYNIPKMLLGRLGKAKKCIESAILDANYDRLFKYAKNFRELYADCFNLWMDNSCKDILEYSEAEYLKYLILYSVGSMFSCNNSLYSLKTIALDNAKKCKIETILK